MQFIEGRGRFSAKELFMKKCPYCGNLLPETAIRCKFCRKVLSKVQVKETKFHKNLREIIVPNLLKPSILVLLIIAFVVIALLLILPLINLKRKELIDWIKNLTILGWIGTLFIIGCFLFLFNILVQRKKYFEEDIQDVCFYSGASIEYVGEWGHLDIGENIIFTPYKENMKPITFPLKDIIKVRTERDLKEEPGWDISHPIYAPAEWVGLSALGSARRRSYLFFDCKTVSGKKMIAFETHKKSRQNKILKDKIEKLINLKMQLDDKR